MRNLIYILACILFINTSYAAEEVILKPEMRAEPRTAALYSVNTKELMSFLESIVIFESKAEFNALPYVLSFSHDKNMGVAGDLMYAAGLSENDISAYTLINYGKTLIDPVTKKEICVEAYVAGNAELTQLGDPSSLIITDQQFNIDIGSKLVARVGLDLPATIDATIPDRKLSGYVLATEHENISGGNNGIVVVSVGARDGIVIGNVFDLIEVPKNVEDPVTKKKVEVPVVKYGEILVYQVYDKVSLAIIVRTDRAVSINDMIISRSPEV